MAEDVTKVGDMPLRHQQLYTLMQEANGFLKTNLFPGIVYRMEIILEGRLLQIGVRYEDGKHFCVWLATRFAAPYVVAATVYNHFLLVRNEATANTGEDDEAFPFIMSDDDQYASVRLPGIPVPDPDGDGSEGDEKPEYKH